MSEMQNSNPNTNTADISPSVEKSGADSAFSSFDELEAVENYQTRSKEIEKEEGKAKVETKAKPEKKEKPEGKASKKKEDAEETDDESTEDSSKEAPVDEKEKETAQAKTIKAKDGETEVDLKLDVKIPVKVQGQETEVSLEELRNNYAGRVAWDARFSELGRKEQKFERIKNDFASAWQEWSEVAQQDGLSALCKMAEMNGQDPLKFRKDFLDSLMPALEKRMAMSEDERKAADMEWELQQLRNRDESHRKSKEEQDALQALKSKVDDLQQTHQIDPETFENTFQSLLKLQQQGKIKDTITPDMVAEVVVHERRLTNAESAVDGLGLNVDVAARDKMVSDLLTVAQANPDLTPEDLKEIARDAWGKTKAQNLSRKIQKAQGEGAKAKASHPVAPQSEPLSFDEL